jgi:hypothetical protein
MTDIWGDYGLSIILLPSGELGSKILDAAREWTSLSLISPALWVKPAEANLDQKPIRQRALVLQHDGINGHEETEVDVFELLSTRERIAKLRVVTVTNLFPGHEDDPQDIKKANLLRDYLGKSMVLPSSGQSGSENYPGVEFLNLVVSPTQLGKVDLGRLRKDQFLATFIASPEDRATPLSADGFIRSDDLEKFVTFSLMHISTVAGVWSGLPDGTLDLIRKQNFQPSSVHVSRVFVSAILTEGLAARAVARVLSRVADPKSGYINPVSGLPVQGTAPIAADQREPFLELLLAKVLEFEDSALRFKSPIPLRAPGQLQLSFLAAIKDFLKFTGGKIASLPLSLLRGFVWWLAKIFNQMFFGGNKGHAVVSARDPKFDSMDIQLLKVWSDVTQLKVEADRSMKLPAAFSGAKVTSQLWSDMRFAIFSLLDGSNQERYGFVDTDAAEPVYPIFYRVNDLLSDPSKPTLVPDPESEKLEVSLGWADFEAYENLMQRCEASVAKNTQEVQETLDLESKIEEELRQVRESISSLQSQIIARTD